MCICLYIYISYAYVWYAASITYLCSAFVAMDILRNRRLQEGFEFPAKTDVDFVLLYDEEDLIGEDAVRLIKSWNNLENGRAIKVKVRQDSMLNNIF